MLAARSSKNLKSLPNKPVISTYCVRSSPLLKLIKSCPAEGKISAFGESNRDTYLGALLFLIITLEIPFLLHLISNFHRIKTLLHKSNESLLDPNWDSCFRLIIKPGNWKEYSKPTNLAFALSKFLQDSVSLEVKINF